MTSARTVVRFFTGMPLSWMRLLSTARAKYPLLVLSHGTGGSADSLDWLASALAAARLYRGRHQSSG